MKKNYILCLVLLLIEMQSFAQGGKVGINTTTPAAMLHVKDSSVVFTGINPLIGPFGNTPVSGAGTRMMWYPMKAAFRTGNVNGAQWNKDSIGLYSIALGRNTLAKSESSTALGNGSMASGLNSTAIGVFTKASGVNSTAIGLMTKASAPQSTAMGNGSTASAENSTAMGNGSTASGLNSTAMGSGTMASSFQSTAMGHVSIASGETSTAMGSGTVASGDYSTTMGSSTFANGVASTAMGSQTIAIGVASTAMGLSTNANSYASVVLGQFNDITSISSTDWNLLDPVFIIGNGTSAGILNNAMTVLKNGNVGIGPDVSPAHRLHITNTDANDGGWTEGIVVESTSPFTGEAAISFRNVGMPADKQWIVGLNQNPNLAFNYGSSFAGGSTPMVIDTFGNVGINTTGPLFLLEVIGTAGKSGGGVWTASSDIRLKQDIKPYTDGLYTLMQIKPISYRYNVLSGHNTVPEYVGVLAQQLKEIAPYMVSVSKKVTADGVNDYLQVDNSAMTYMLINAVKEQQEMINKQQSQIDFLLEELTVVKQQLNKKNH